MTDTFTHHALPVDETTALARTEELSAFTPSAEWLAAEATAQTRALPSAPMLEIRLKAEKQINKAVDNLAGQIPGGPQFAPETKRAIADALDDLQKNLEREAVSRMGELGYQIFGKQPR